jgi:hypothetical protein
LRTFKKISACERLKSRAMTPQPSRDKVVNFGLIFLPRMDTDFLSLWHLWLQS